MSVIALWQQGYDTWRISKALGRSEALVERTLHRELDRRYEQAQAHKLLLNLVENNSY